MVPFIQNPQQGRWYLSAVCPYCKCRMILLPDLNNGIGSITGVFCLTCPQCHRDQNLPAEHYHHVEGNEANVSKREGNCG